MIPESIQRYLEQHRINYQRRPHRRVITAQELAASLHVTGFQVAKSVLVRADGRPCIAVLSAPDSVDTGKLAELLGASQVELLDEDAFKDLFPGCELGAEPPFGGLFELPVVCDESLRSAERLLFRAGSHEEALEMRLEDFLRLESPRLGRFIQERIPRPAAAPVELHA